ncbi:hypothetical protein ACHQM5_002712 [Ranunculus cassubicifolius]
MPSKLRKAIGAVKDQTSISLAKVSSNNSSNLEVAILKATTHEEVAVEDRYVNEIVLLTSSNKLYAAACAQALSKRISRTRNWIVALKGLMIVLRVFQDGDPYFPREVLITMKRGGKILNLSNFRDDYNSSPWDYTAFVRTVAIYLSERLDCFLTGKLQRRMVMKDKDQGYYQPHRQRCNEHVRDMKPAVLIDRIKHWQELLDKAIGTRPTGAAKTNRLVQISLHGIVRETFDLYRDISDGLALLLDSFFHLPYQTCVDAFQACVRSSKQFEELSSFYIFCKENCVGRSSEYPSIQNISQELMETLNEFLKDKSPFQERPPLRSEQLQLPPPPPRRPRPTRRGRDITVVVRVEPHERHMSLEDLISSTEPGTSPSSYSIVCREEKTESIRPQSSSSIEDFLSLDTPVTSPIDKERRVEKTEKFSSVDDLLSLHTAGTSPARSFDDRNSSVTDLTDIPAQVQSGDGETEKPMKNLGILSSIDDLLSLHTAGTSPARSADDQNSSVMDLTDIPPQVQSQDGETEKPSNNPGKLPSVDDLFSLHTALTSPAISSPVAGHYRVPSRDEWERVLAETAANLCSVPSNQADQSDSYSNPFLTVADDFSAITPFSAAGDAFPSRPTLQASPTFCARNPNETIGNDLFSLPINVVQPSIQGNQLMREQQLWLQNQNQIISKHIA